MNLFFYGPLEETLIPRIGAFLAERGVALSAEKTKITHISEGFDFLGQTLCKYVRPGGKPAKLQITPSKASLQAVQAKVKALCKLAAGRTPECPGLDPGSTLSCEVGPITIVM